MASGLVCVIEDALLRDATKHRCALRPRLLVCPWVLAWCVSPLSPARAPAFVSTGSWCMPTPLHGEPSYDSLGSGMMWVRKASVFSSLSLVSNRSSYLSCFRSARCDVAWESFANFSRKSSVALATSSTASAWTCFTSSCSFMMRFTALRGMATEFAESPGGSRDLGRGFGAGTACSPTGAGGASSLTRGSCPGTAIISLPAMWPSST
mmetsp:Transcript_20624/g.60272  ORF Transcript_20624/g.60272 Transcript_20624/m.60272 type:complete len:208 (-) Transcript_20624:82-705(-)